jgi:NAD(P)-dependent dehydrogenase (short-subunit alcohol dehydrogenase family)
MRLQTPLLFLLIAIACYFLFSNPRYTVHERGAILITGAAKGIGRHAAEALARELGPNFLILAGVRSARDVAELRALGLPTLEAVTLDVSTEAGVNAGMREVDAALKKHDVPLTGVVNNAGQARGPTTVEFHDAADAEALFAVNFFGSLRVTQAALPLLRASRGRVVFITSIFGALAPPQGGIYAASKFAMEALADSLRREVAPFGVSVSVVRPGAVATPIFATLRDASISAAVAAGSPAAKVYPHLHTAADVRNEELLERLAAGPASTTAVIMDALRAERPRTRYLCANLLGVPVRVFAALAALLPDRALDVVLGLK